MRHRAIIPIRAVIIQDEAPMISVLEFWNIETQSGLVHGAVGPLSGAHSADKPWAVIAYQVATT
jgi:hypothetical protein